MPALQSVWVNALKPAPEEVVLGDFRTNGAVAIPDLRRAMVLLAGVTNAELLDISFHGTPQLCNGSFVRSVGASSMYERM